MAKGVNIDIRKRNKRNYILNIIRDNPGISKIDTKNISKYSMSTVLSVVAELTERKLIMETGNGESKVGRKPSCMEVNPDGGYFLGVEFNAEFLYSVVLNLLGKVIFRKKYEIVMESDITGQVLDLILMSIREMKSHIGDKQDKIMGIGIGAPGFVDDTRGISIYYPHLAGWKDVELKSRVEAEFGIITYVESNVNAMALAYKWLRPDIYGEDFLLISIRTGIRMSCILNGQLHKGKDNTAGEIGHVQVGSSGRLCSCGRKGCLEAEISNKSITLKLREGIERGRYIDLYELAGRNPADVSIRTFVESYRLGHADTKELFKEICGYLGDAISGIVNILNPARIVISGDITGVGDELLSRVRAILDEKAVFVNLRELKLEYSSFDDDIGALGAAALVMNKEFEVFSRVL